MGSLIRIAAIEDDELLLEGLREEGFIKDRVTIDPALLLDYLSPFVEPTQVERFRFSREWMQTQFQRVNNPRDPSYTVALKINLPPSYLLIHRTWLGGIGVLSQLEAEAPFRGDPDRVAAGVRGPGGLDQGRCITCSPTSPCVRESNASGTVPTSGEAQRLPQTYGGGVGLDDGVELDRHGIRRPGATARRTPPAAGRPRARGPPRRR